MAYHWQQADWPHFSYDASKFEQAASVFIQKSAYARGVLDGTETTGQEQSILDMLVQEAIRSSAIEGEFLSRNDLVSSIKKQLGWPVASKPVRDPRAAGMAELLVKSRQTFADDLSENMLFDWHLWLMRGSRNMLVGQWREHEAPMQVVSGSIGSEIVHFEAPPSGIVREEMQGFISWFNESGPSGKEPVRNPLIRSALAHLYFESIHPFEDGNGRIGRVVAEKALSQHIAQPALLSLSSIIENHRGAYYAALQKAQRSNQCDAWIAYFSDVVLQAQDRFIAQVSYSIKKARFFDKHRHQLNERQHKVIGKMLELEEGEFTGGINARKYQSITKSSKATATRDLQDLVAKELITASGAGRSIGYQVNLDA